ncbi:MAG: hypothetical protein HKN24_02415 [Acidimicrobiales bacterium]|nr:hypothetical protein [Acidimicrobiales bacterium]
MIRSTPPVTDPVGVVGLGRVGSHAARQLRSGTAPLVIFDSNTHVTERVLGALRPVDRAAAGPDLAARTVVLATPAGRHTAAAATLIRAGSSVVSTSDDPKDVRGLLALDRAARQNGVTVVAGVGLSPGYSCLHALFASRHFERVEELSVWTTGTAGPACASRHHRSLQLPGQVIIDGQWVEKRGGSGRDLAWFPGELGARDCYRGSLAEPILLRRLFPHAQRISSRTSATRRDRLTGALPMLRRPHLDGGPGGIRVEVRGLADGGYRTEVVGMMGFPSVAAGATAAVAALHVHHNQPSPGAMGLAELVDGNPRTMLAELHARGITASRFEGAS